MSRKLLSLVTSSVALTMILLSTANGGSISEGLMSKLEGGQKSDAILELPSIFGNVISSNPLLNMMSGFAKVNMMTSLLKQATSASQAPFMSVISSLGLAESATPFWISNDINLKNVDMESIQTLAALPGVFTLREPAVVKVNPVGPGSNVDSETLHRASRQTQAQWGVSKIQAPAVWSARTRGANVVVAGIDTGVYREHESLKDNYGGKWHDPVYGNSSPTDGQGHGTHTMGKYILLIFYWVITTS